jgi:hypothetical protein
VIVDIEKVVTAYLSGESTVTALDTRVVGRTPRDRDSSWVRLTQLDANASPRSRADHLIAYALQLDCYSSAAGVDGSPRKEAMLIARTVREALRVMPGTHEDAVVTSVRFAGMIRVPDTDLEPARERVILTALVHAHPAP